jgi:hypothetical protein
MMINQILTRSFPGLDLPLQEKVGAGRTCGLDIYFYSVGARSAEGRFNSTHRHVCLISSNKAKAPA